MEMNCEHGISIHHDCDACTAQYTSENQVWETKQIRRELTSVELRITSAMRERGAERRRRIEAEKQLEEMKLALVEIPADEWHEDDGPALWWRLPVQEPPWVGSPLDDDWMPGYYTHWMPLASITPKP